MLQYLFREYILYVSSYVSFTYSKFCGKYGILTSCVSVY